MGGIVARLPEFLFSLGLDPLLSHRDTMDLLSWQIRTGPLSSHDHSDTYVFNGFSCASPDIDCERVSYWLKSPA